MLSKTLYFFQKYFINRFLFLMSLSKEIYLEKYEKSNIVLPLFEILCIPAVQRAKPLKSKVPVRKSESEHLPRKVFSNTTGVSFYLIWARNKALGYKHPKLGIMIYLIFSKHCFLESCIYSLNI